MCADLSGKVNVNHIFSVSGDDPEVAFVNLHQSNLKEHSNPAHKISKKSRKLSICVPEADALCGDEPVQSRQNIWKNYHPNVPPEFYDNELYIEPTAVQWAKVKVERLDRSEFRAVNRLKKYAMKESLESVVLNGDGGS